MDAPEPPAPNVATPDARITALDRSLAELRALETEEFLRDSLPENVERFERWHARALARLSQFSQHDTAHFEAIRDVSGWPPFFRWQTKIGPLLEEHAAFLTALRAEIAAHPDDYEQTDALRIRRVLRDAGYVPPSGSGDGPALPATDKITLRWLTQNVPVSFWIGIIAATIGLLSGAFVAGYKIGHDADASKVLAPALGK